MNSAVVHRAGCPVCASVEPQFAAALEATRHRVDGVQLTELK
jgi:hypothetical protein